MPSRLPTKSDFPPNLILDIITPPSGSNKPPTNVLILLHGLGDTHSSFTALARNLNLPETACLSLRGLNPIPPLFTGSETPAFHWGDDVLVDEGKGEIDPDAGFEMVRSVVGGIVLRVLTEECGFKEREILFLGFGQGGMAALSVVSSGDFAREEFGGVITIGGRLPGSSSSDAAKAKCKTPILLCGGSRSSQVTRSAVDAVKARFTDVEYVKWEKGEDSMPRNREEMLPLMKFLARRLRSRAGVPEGAVEV
ncbi:phospholipase/Carboxylesterase superfamily protein [Rhexocercosporidium sp. MPI-PUGE-AT-0058]|nr:phospholipase/Carboxylesterase superfamily protein [Rhexocercosporidium sp. MPI-PUGE-AT-0058]